MNYKNSTFTTLVLLFMGVSMLQAQKALLSTGGETSGSGGTTSYSVGQVIYTANSGSSGSMSNGVQQPFEISVVTAIEVARDINLLISAHPNPANNFLVLKVEHFDIDELLYQLYDINGKVYEKARITEKESVIKMSALSPNIYFIRIMNNDNEIKTFKIIKN